MSLHDYVLANQSGANFRADLNNLAAAIASHNSGATDPAGTFSTAYLLWADTGNDLMKQRNAANSAWISMWKLSLGMPTFPSVTTKGDLLAANAAGALARIAVGADGKVLNADSAQTAGVGWQYPAQVTGAGRNISARTNATNPNFQIDIDADELIVKDTNGVAKLLMAVNLTGDITASGANGLDAGSEAASTWYYGYVIAKADGTVAALISASSSSPTMPSGYTFKALVSAVRNNGSSNFIPHFQRGNQVYYSSTNRGVLNVGTFTATTETSLLLSTAIPPIAESYAVSGLLYMTCNTAGNFNGSLTLRVFSGIDFIVKHANTFDTGQTLQVTASGPLDAILLPNTGNLYGICTNAVGTTGADIGVDQFTLPGGGQ